jgi:hypothetical protein
MLDRVLALVDLNFALLQLFQRDNATSTTRSQCLSTMIRKLKGDKAVEKTRLKTVKRRRINAFLPVPVEPLPEPLRQAEQDLFPAFQPPFRIDYDVSYFFYSFAL